MRHLSKSTASSALKFIWTAGKVIHDRVKLLAENNEHRQKIESSLKELDRLCQDLEELNFDDLPTSCSDFINTSKQSVEICNTICGTLHHKKLHEKACFAPEDEQLLQNLDDELKRIKTNLQYALSSATHAETKRLRAEHKKNSQACLNAALNPDAGVYTGGSGTAVPAKIEKPSVELDRDLMVVSWRDEANSGVGVTHYEVQYDDERGETLRKKASKLRTSEEHCYRVKLGTPRVTPGHLYTVQICAINGEGPGEWSEGTTFWFKQGPPSPPHKPTLSYPSPTEIALTVKKQSEGAETDCPVTRYLVEYVDLQDDSNNSWITAEHEVVSDDEQYIQLLTKLKPGKTNYIRIRAVNAVGKTSRPCERQLARTTQPIPGKPQRVRISRYRKATLIKIHWSQPLQHPEAVAMYRVQRVKSGSSKFTTREWQDVTTVGADKLSAKAKDLDINTLYLFRVAAINSDGNETWSDTEEASTHYGPFVSAIGATVAFFVGTVGGPVVGAMAFGVSAGVAAEGAISQSDADLTEQQQTAAATLAGIGAGFVGVFIGLLAAPAMGILTSAVIYKKMSGDLDITSPQSSGDEMESETGRGTDNGSDIELR